MPQTGSLLSPCMTLSRYATMGGSRCAMMIAEPMSRLLYILVLLLGSAGCARVNPWQREVHGSRPMRVEPDRAEAKLDGHVTEYREGSIGGGGVGGGGCGCN